MVSRVAKNPIKIPSGVEVRVTGQELIVKGKLGELSEKIHSKVKIIHDNNDNTLRFKAVNDSKKVDALTGTSRAVANNMVRGVSEGFVQKLNIVGVGYRAKAQGDTLNLTLGFSHPVVMKMPKVITVETPSNTEIIVKGANKQQVSQVAADICSHRPPEPYKGKGIRDENKQVVRKEAKKK